MNWEKRIKSLLIISLLFVAIIGFPGNKAYAGTIGLYPHEWTLKKWRDGQLALQEGKYEPSVTDNGQHNNVGGDFLDQVWYYVLENTTGGTMKVTLDLYGASDYQYNSGRLVATDTIPAYTSRMYIYTVFTEANSHEMVEVCSLDAPTNGNTNIANYSNFRSLMIVAMGDNTNSKRLRTYTVAVNKDEDGKGNEYGFYDGKQCKLNKASRIHYIQFLYSNGDTTVKKGQWVQSAHKSIKKTRSERDILFEYVDEFNPTASASDEYNMLTPLQATSSVPWYKYKYVTYVSSDAGSANTAAKSFHTGCLDMTWELSDVTPPTVSVTPSKNPTTDSTVRINVSATDTSGIKAGSVKIQAIYGGTQNTSKAMQVAATGSWYYDFTFDNIPNANGGTKNGVGKYYFRACATDNAGNTSSWTAWKEVIRKGLLTKPTVSGSYTYNGSAQTVTLNNYNASLMNVANNSKTDAGSYTATVSLKDTTLYSWTDKTTNNVNLNWSIAKRGVAVTWGTTSFTYNGSAQKPTVTTPVNGVGNQKVNLTVDGAQTNVGSAYTATAKISSVTNGNANNYALTNATKTFSIAKRSFNVPTANAGTYSGVSQTASLNNFNSSAMNVTNNTRIDAGTQNVTVSLKDTTNNQWADKSTGAKSVSWTVNPKSLTVTWGTTASFTYNGSAQAPTVTSPINGVNGEKVNIVRTTQTNVGNYTSTASISSVTSGRAKASNYALSNTTKSYSITKRLLTRPTAVQKTYTYNKKEQTFEVNNFDANYMNISNNKMTDAGQKTVTISLKDKTNYGWQTNGATDDINFTFTINKATAHITTSTNEVIKKNEKNIPTTYASNGDENIPITYSYDGDGTITASSSDTSLATVELNKEQRNVKITRVSTNKSGTLDVTISAAGTTNYSPASATIHVRVVDVTPRIVKMEINGGASTTKNLDVTVGFQITSANDISHMYISESNVAPSEGNWVKYEKYSIFRLSRQNGEKTLYAWVKDAYGNVSVSSTASINLNMKYDLMVKCNQSHTFSEAVKTLYALKMDGEEEFSWQESDSFTGLIINRIYTVKTKIDNMEGMSRESNELRFKVVFDDSGKLVIQYL